MARPSRSANLEATAKLAGVRPTTVRDFFFRVGKLSPATRARVAASVVETGYRPGTPTRQLPLKSIRVGYELPRMTRGAMVSPVMSKQLPLFIQGVQQAGGALLPYVIELPPGIDHWSEIPSDTSTWNPTEVESGDANGTDDIGSAMDMVRWRAEYASALSVETMHSFMRKQRVNAFIVNDPRVDDPRLLAAAREGINAVSLTVPMSSSRRGGMEVVEKVSWVANDYDRGFGALIADLRATGRRRIGHLGYEPDGTVVPLVRRAAVAGHLPDGPHMTLRYGGSDSARLVRDVAAWVRDNDLDAVLCDSDDMALLTQRAGSTELGLSVERTAPVAGSLAVTGVDDATARQDQPAATRWPTIALDHEQYVAAAIDALGERAATHRSSSHLVPPIVIGAYQHRDPEHRDYLL